MVDLRRFIRDYTVAEPEVFGVTVPNDLAGVREVANWIRAEGYSVPFLNRDGLLVHDKSQEFYCFYASGTRIGLFKEGLDEIGWTYKTEEELSGAE